MIKVATIAGSDASGGAGLEADLKTFEEYGLYGMTAVTVIATMDPAAGWSHSVFAIPKEELRKQMETIFNGVGVDACKSGMLGTEYAVDLAREYITKYKIENYVLDPVMACKGANQPLNPELNRAMAEKLVPLAKVVTPNLFEAQQISGLSSVATLEEMEEAAKIIVDKGAKSVYIKGGSKLASSASSKKAVDLFYDGDNFGYIDSPLIETIWTHGAGCTTAAAITAGLARGLTPKDAVILAKKFITQSLSASWQLNQYVGPGNPSSYRSKKGLFE